MASESHHEEIHVNTAWATAPPAPAPAPSKMAQASGGFADTLVDTYFARVHGKPYHVLDEPATRQRLRDGQLPRYVLNAMNAVSLRYAEHLCGSHDGAVQISQDYALRARLDIDVDEPTIEHLQALLLLAIAGFQSGKGRKSYMLLSHAITMAFALSLHRELPAQLRIAPSEREGRRKLFWTCYLMDRFTVSGSKRPSLISDESVHLRLPAWLPSGSHTMMEGTYFRNGSCLSHVVGGSSAGQGSGAMLVEIVRVLGITNRYLAAGGVKGDSHFPWHMQSTLSRIRSDLDFWAANTQDAFTSIEALFGQPDSSTLVLSKLIYHLIHCLVYRPFLPVDLAELSGTGQHQSWQIEATNLCFLHANAIAELVEIGRTASVIEWPSFVGYCICTAGTIHVTGAHYMSLGEGELFSNSADFLSREMAQLSDLQHIWSGVQHQRDTLEAVYASHTRLVQSLAANPIRFSPVFQMEDFFDRYPGSYIDGAHVPFSDIDPGTSNTNVPFDRFSNAYLQGVQQPLQDMNIAYQDTVPSQYMTQNRMPPTTRKKKKRRTALSSQPQTALQCEPEQLVDLALESQVSREGWVPPQDNQFETAQPEATRVEATQVNGYHDTENVQTNSQLPTANVTQTALLPVFDFSSTQQPPNPQPMENGWHDPFYGFDQQTPGGFSTSAESAHTDADKDPFLSLLEQMAQNGEYANGGPSELDFFLNGQG